MNLNYSNQSPIRRLSSTISYQLIARSHPHLLISRCSYMRRTTSCRSDNNVVLIRDYLEDCKLQQRERSLIFCDFEKAYDRVRWRWLWRVLKHVGIDGRLLALIKASPSLRRVSRHRPLLEEAAPLGAA